MFTRKQLAEQLNVHIHTIDKWTAKGMPCTRVGRVIRFDIGKVKAWMERQGIIEKSGILREKNVRYSNLNQMIQSLESSGFTDEFGNRLEMNMVFIKLKELAEKEGDK